MAEKFADVRVENGYLDHFAFWRVFGWLSKRHLPLTKHTLVRRFLPGWEIWNSVTP
jgi:hypothetical protein